MRSHVKESVAPCSSDNFHTGICASMDGLIYWRMYVQTPVDDNFFFYVYTVIVLVVYLIDT